MLLFKGNYTVINFPVKRDLANRPPSHFPRTHYSIIPVFQHSNCERSELSPAWNCKCGLYPNPCLADASSCFLALSGIDIFPVICYYENVNHQKAGLKEACRASGTDRKNHLHQSNRNCRVNDKVMRIKNNYDKEVYYVLLQRNLIYTAVTRGRKLVVIVGTRKAMAIGVKNDKTQKRYTCLRYRLNF